MNSRWKKYIRAWLPVVLWLGIIAIESTEALSSAHTGALLYRILSALFGTLDHAKFDIFHAVLRKIGHFVGYATLSLLIFRGLLVSLSADTKKNAGTLYRKYAAIAISCTFLVAAADEFHQTLLPERGGAFHDVLLDTAGAVVLQTILLAYLRQRRTSTAA